MQSTTILLEDVHTKANPTMAGVVYVANPVIIGEFVLEISSAIYADPLSTRLRVIDRHHGPVIGVEVTIGQ